MEETLGKRIARHRKALALTQDALAEQLGVTAQAVSKWENNQSYPDITLLPKLAEVFCTTTDALLGIASFPPQADEKLPEPPQPEPQQRHLSDYRSSPLVPFGTWFFLTGLVLCIVRMRNMLCGIEDIAIASAIFVFGLFGFLQRLSVLRLGCAVVGGLFVLNLAFDPSIGDIDWTLPLAAGLSLFGLDLLLQPLRSAKKGNPPMPPGHCPPEPEKNYLHCNGSCFDCTTTFGESSQKIQLPRLTVGTGQVFFGNLTLDLSSCSEIEDGCTLDLLCCFGTLQLLIPSHCRTETACSTAFGNLHEIGSCAANSTCTVSIKGSVHFGQITIHYI